MTQPQHHKHIHDPELGDSTHCICHNFAEPPSGGCGRVNCVNRERLAQEAEENGSDTTLSQERQGSHTGRGG